MAAPFCTGLIDMNMKQSNNTEALAGELKILERLGDQQITFVIRLDLP